MKELAIASIQSPSSSGAPSAAFTKTWTTIDVCFNWGVMREKRIASCQFIETELVRCSFDFDFVNSSSCKWPEFLQVASWLTEALDRPGLADLVKNFELHGLWLTGVWVLARCKNDDSRSPTALFYMAYSGSGSIIHRIKNEGSIYEYKLLNFFFLGTGLKQPQLCFAQ